jgi:hypothetical protein
MSSEPEDGVTALELRQAGLPKAVLLEAMVFLSYRVSVCTACQCHQTVAGGLRTAIPRDALAKEYPFLFKVSHHSRSIISKYVIGLST